MRKRWISSACVLLAGLTIASCGGSSGSSTAPSGAQYTLSVAFANAGSGSVVSNPSGINCPSTCQASFASGTQVTLTATAAQNSTFTGWAGAGCFGTSTCTVSLLADAAVTATFPLQNGVGVQTAQIGLSSDWADGVAPPMAPYGTVRLWDDDLRWNTFALLSDGTNACVPGQPWSGGTCTATNNNWTWAPLDDMLANIHIYCPTCDVEFTFGGVAQYANNCPGSGCPPGDPDGVSCANTGNNGGCFLPPDLSSDGTGTDQSFIDYFTFFATHVAGLNPSTYAPITYLEAPWNEYDRDACLDDVEFYNPQYCVNGNQNGLYSVYATYSQLQRIFLDAKATILPILPKVKFLQGNLASPVQRTMLNMMYCDDSPSTSCSFPLSGSVTDGMSWHEYLEGTGVGTGRGELLAAELSKLRGWLKGTDQKLPWFMTEGSWGPQPMLPDYDMQAGFTARYLATCVSTSGLARCFWYRYNHPCSGELYGILAGYPGCEYANLLYWSGKAFNQSFTWLVGNTVSPCSSVNNIWTCNITTGDGISTQMVWWDEQGANSTSWCQGSTPVAHGTCDMTGYNYPSQYQHYYTLDPSDCPAGGCALGGGTVQISGKPILLMP